MVGTEQQEGYMLLCHLYQYMNSIMNFISPQRAARQTHRTVDKNEIQIKRDRRLPNGYKLQKYRDLKKEIKNT